MLRLYPNGTRTILTGDQILTCNPETWLKVLEIIRRVCGPDRENIHSGQPASSIDYGNSTIIEGEDTF